MARSGRGRAGKLAMGVAAVGVATSVAGVAATQPASISASLVDLAALIVVGSSTNPSGAGVENFFQGKFNTPLYTGPDGNDITYVNFFSGPLGIKQALEANAGEPNAILSSGWGAANASLLMLLNDPAFSDTVVILDNDVARPDGGFGTRYPWFALIGVNPIPTPSDVPALAAVNTGYQYDYNSNAPADVFNPFAAVNALAAYLTTRLNQAEIDLPVDEYGTPTVTCNANTCAMTTSGAVLDCPDARCSSPDDPITAYVTTRNNTTYVTYTTDELPLTRLIRGVFGDRIANIVDPLLTLAVNSAYYDNNPIPRDPSAYRPARLFPSPADLLGTIARIPGAIAQTIAAISGPTQTASTSDKPETTPFAVTNDESKTDEPPSTTLPDDVTKNSKPLTNVVRDSIKAVPGETGTLTTPTDTQPVTDATGTTAPATQTPTETVDRVVDSPTNTVAPDAEPGTPADSPDPSPDSAAAA